MSDILFGGTRKTESTATNKGGKNEVVTHHGRARSCHFGDNVVLARVMNS